MWRSGWSLPWGERIRPLLNPKVGKLFRMVYAGHLGLDSEDFPLLKPI